MNIQLIIGRGLPVAMQVKLALLGLMTTVTSWRRAVMLGGTATKGNQCKLITCTAF